MGKDTKAIIATIFMVGFMILTVLGYWHLGLILWIFYFFLPKSKEVKTKELQQKILFHLFKKRDLKDKNKTEHQIEKELKEMEKIADEIENK
ncbi:MAG: hypothetical protein ABH896_05125 [Candidatus Jacksonbacteria bacterium]